MPSLSGRLLRVGNRVVGAQLLLDGAVEAGFQDDVEDLGGAGTEGEPAVEPVDVAGGDLLQWNGAYHRHDMLGEHFRITLKCARLERPLLELQPVGSPFSQRNFIGRDVRSDITVMQQPA